MLMVGSGALQFWGLLVNRQPKDYDFIVTIEEYLQLVKDRKNRINVHYPLSSSKSVIKFKNGIIHEFEIAFPGSTAAELLDITNKGPFVYFNCDGDTYATPELLYALKMSHRYLKNSPHFLKTMNDVNILRKHMNTSEIHPGLIDWYKRRKIETYAYKHPILNQNKDGFFSNDGVQYIYDHDTIHEAMKFYDQPAYKYYQPVDNDVLCSKELWDKEPRDVKLFGVLEEALVLALERSQIPHPEKMSTEQSFLKALEKVCTSITSGWFREFAWENYDSIVTMFKGSEEYRPYVERFNKALDSGQIKAYK